MAIYKLLKPIKIDGEEKTELEYDFDNLTGEDLQNATKDLTRNGMTVSVTELDTNYHAAIFAKSADIAFEDMKRLSARDYTKCTSLVRDFFLADTEASSQRDI